MSGKRTGRIIKLITKRNDAFSCRREDKIAEFLSWHTKICPTIRHGSSPFSAGHCRFWFFLPGCLSLIIHLMLLSPMSLQLVRMTSSFSNTRQIHSAQPTNDTRLCELPYTVNDYTWEMYFCDRGFCPTEISNRSQCATGLFIETRFVVVQNRF